MEEEEVDAGRDAICTHDDNSISKQQRGRPPIKPSPAADKNPLCKDVRTEWITSFASGYVAAGEYLAAKKEEGGKCQGRDGEGAFFNQI